MNSYNNTKIRKTNKIIQETADIYLTNKSRNRNSNNDPSATRKQDYETLKNATRKSIENNVIQATKNAINTIYQTSQPAKNYYKRVSHNFRKQIGLQRYDEDERDQSRNNRSPYQKKQIQGRTSVIDRSSQKIKSGQLIKQSVPYQFYRQPRSSLSQHYDPSIDTSLHKRKVSNMGDDRNYLLDEAKQLYRTNNYTKSIDLLKKYVKLHKGSIQGHYLLGMSYINNSDFNLGIDELNYTIDLDPQYKKSLYLVISLAYKKLQKYDEAIEILNKGLERYPEYYDCLVYRGKLCLKKQNYQLALRDFTAAIQVNKYKGFAYIGKGTCQKQLGKIDEAIKSFSEGIQSDMANLCYEKRGLAYYQTGKLALALRDLDYCCQIDGYQSSTAHYFRGMVLYKEKKIVEALLCFEEALKIDNHRQYVTLAVEMMIKIKIEQKDFYEAYHILTRADNVDADKQILNQWRLFLEASLFLMKKKYKQGLDTYKSLLSLNAYKMKWSQIKNRQTKERIFFLKPIIYLYKAFGQLCENKPENAQKQYELYDEICKQIGISGQNLSKDYNNLIMKAYKMFPKDSKQIIQQAIKLIPTKPEPYLFLAFDLIQNKFQLEQSPTQKGVILDQIIYVLSTGIGHLPQLSNNHISTFYYYRAIVYLYKSDFQKSVADIDKAIEKSQDNIAKYFYLRGLIFAIFGNFSQSVQDLSVAINLNEKYAKPYLERAKCLQIEGNSNEAFLDLQKYITLAPQDQHIHKYAGYLLFQNCAYEDCLSAFSHGVNLEDDYELILTKAKCHFLLGDYNQAINLFKKYSSESYNTQFDSDCQIISICSKITKETSKNDLAAFLTVLDKILSEKKEQECKIFKFRDMHQIKASIFMILAQFSKAIEELNKTLELFNIQKTKQMQKHFIEDEQEFEDQWSEVEIKFNISICYLCIQKYREAQQMLVQFQKCSEKGKNWNVYMKFIDDLIHQKVVKKNHKIQLDTFEQNHRISKLWPKIQLPGFQTYLSMAFSYPFVQPPQLMPEFDHQLFEQFQISKTENKPEAPWINRCDKGLIFTPNIQVYQNLELSMTTTKKNEESEKNKPVSQMDNSISMSNSDFQLQTEELKKKFKLDSLIEMKLNRLINK